MRVQKRSNNPRDFLDAGETALVEEALKRAEAGTSAQIKFVIVRHCWGHIRDKAARRSRSFSFTRSFTAIAC